ncbi:MAG: hypothetical protein JWR16_3456 [Nevskia sp.]|nr:hypothetical protein [Nevskia sp.]
MSSSDSAATLDLQLAPSLRALGVVMVLHVSAIGLAFMAQPPKFVALGLAVLFIISWFSLRRHPAFGYGPRALRRLVAHGDGSWTVETARASERASLLPGSFAHAALVVVRFKTAGGATKVRTLFGDETSAEQLRRLRARLLLGAKESGAAAE